MEQSPESPDEQTVIVNMYIAEHVSNHLTALALLDETSLAQQLRSAVDQHMESGGKEAVFDAGAAQSFMTPYRERRFHQQFGDAQIRMRLSDFENLTTISSQKGNTFEGELNLAIYNYCQKRLNDPALLEKIEVRQEQIRKQGD